MEGSSLWRQLFWGLVVGILGAWLYDRWKDKRAPHGEGFVAHVQRFFDLPSDYKSTRAPGTANAAVDLSDSGGCSCRS
jgi:hypothetical protein